MATTTSVTGILLHGVSALTATHNHRLYHHLPNPLKLNLRPTPNSSKPNFPTPLSSKPYFSTPSSSKSTSFFCFSSLNHSTHQPNLDFPQPKTPLISDSTKTVATLFALSLTLSTKITQIITNSFTKFKSLCTTPTPQEVQTLQYLQENVVCTIGPLFFAALKDRPTGYVNTPLTVVAAGMAKWLDIYSGVLLVRVLLSWFPNIPWDRQPLSAIRDLCDPYLNLFRNIIPPIFDTLDISPLFAFTVLGILGSILNSARGF